MNFRFFVELIQLLAMAALLAGLWRYSLPHGLLRERGFRLVLVGFHLLCLGSLTDFSDQFPALAPLVVFGPTPTQAFVESILGYGAGAVFLALGFWHWLPEVGKRRDRIVEEVRLRALAEERFGRFFDLSVDLLVISDFELLPVHRNASWERLLGVSRTELEAVPAESWVHPDDRERVEAAFRELRAGASAGQFESRLVDRNGKVHWISWSTRAVPEEGLFYTAGRDITSLKEHQDQLVAERERAEAANLLKSRFLATMSHELRTPLNSIIGFARVLAKSSAIGDDRRSALFVERIGENGKHLLELINDVLDLSRIEAAEIVLELSDVDLAELIDSVLGQFAPQAALAGIDLRWAVPEEGLAVHADRRRLRQVLVNLVGNAVKFTERGSVTVRVLIGELTGRPLAIEVEDTGIGIDRAQLERVFESFFQADSGHARRHEGSGLGLSIARTLARAMGFEIEAESTPGRGSIFRLLLVPGGEKPLDSSAWDLFDPPRSAVETSGAHSRVLAGRRILVVDDDADARLLLVESIRSAGGETIEAATTAEALALSRTQPPDAATIDLLMPGDDGHRLIAQLAADPALAGLPLVVVSVIGREESGRIPPGVEVLDKPVERRLLCAALERAVVRSKGGGPPARVGGG